MISLFWTLFALSRLLILRCGVLHIYIRVAMPSPNEGFTYADFR